MAPRSPSRITAGLIALALLALVAGCDPSPTITPAPTSTIPASTVPATSVTSSSIAPATGAVTPGDPAMEVLVPEGEGPFPALVLAHGGGWVGGSPSQMGDLARFLTDQGYLTVNTSYTLSNGLAGFPLAVDDVACAVRHAAAHPDSNGSVAIVGFSAGAHIGALVALDGEGRYGDRCSLPDPVTPDRFVGLAGPYDVARLAPLVVPFFGVPVSEDPELWVTGNPLRQAAGDPGLDSLLLHGENDALLDLGFAADFAEALTEAGAEALVEVVEGAGHGDLQHPGVVGDLVAAWLARKG
jgi:acetyl esterase/lipase